MSEFEISEAIQTFVLDVGTRGIQVQPIFRSWIDGVRATGFPEWFYEMTTRRFVPFESPEFLIV